MEKIPLSNINKRFFKFKFNKYWTQEIYFNNEKNLIKFIKEKKPSDAYYSLSTFFNKKRLFKSDLVLDYDNVNKENIIKSMEIFGIPSFILQTNSTHFQLFYENIPLKDTNIWLRKIKENNINVDECVLKDREKRVCRLPYPLKRLDGFIPKILNLEELNKLEYNVIPKEKDNKTKDFYFYKALTSTLEGKSDLQVAVFKNPSIKRLIKIQKIYNMGNIYLLKFPSETVGLTLKLFSLKRTQKIYHAYGKKWKNKFKFIRTSEIIDNNGQIIEGGCKPLQVLESNATGLHSLPHCYFLAHYFNIPKELNYIGKVEDNNIYEIKLYGNLKNG